MTNATTNIRINFAKGNLENAARAAKNLELNLGDIAKDVDCLINYFDAAHGWLGGSLHPEQGDPNKTAAENARVSMESYSSKLAAESIFSSIRHLRQVASQMQIYTNESIAKLNGVID